MPPLPRRALLGTVAAGTLGSVAGCTDPLANLQADERRPSPVAGRSIFVADGLRFPPADGVTRVDDPHALYFGAWFLYLAILLVVAVVEHGLRRLDVRRWLSALG